MVLLRTQQGSPWPQVSPLTVLTLRWGELGSRPRGAAALVFVLEAVRGRWRVLAGKEGAGELGGPGSWRRSGLPLRRGSSVVVVNPSVDGEGSRTEDPHCIRGRGGEREEAVERLRL